MVAGLNTIGQLGLTMYFLGKRGPLLVQGQQMDWRVGDKGSFRSTLELVLDRYEPGTTRLFERILRPSMTMVDIGAHAGYFSLIGASLVGASGTVYAFEPFPQSFQQFQRNIALNGYKNIQAVRKAISDQTGVRKILVNPKPKAPVGNLAFSGLMLATPALLDFIPDTCPVDLGFHVLPQIVGRMAAYRIQDFLIDIGTPETYRAAQELWPARLRAQGQGGMRV
ncbi:MAG: FkbM family methyltransferase [Candidatus Acidiferrum sp.]